MGNQSWQTAVELEAYGGRPFVRVIENGVVRIKAFLAQSELPEPREMHKGLRTLADALEAYIAAGEKQV